MHYDKECELVQTSCTENWHCLDKRRIYLNCAPYFPFLGQSSPPHQIYTDKYKNIHQSIACAGGNWKQSESLSLEEQTDKMWQVATLEAKNPDFNIRVPCETYMISLVYTVCVCVCVCERQLVSLVCHKETKAILSVLNSKPLFSLNSGGQKFMIQIPEILIWDKGSLPFLVNDCFFPVSSYTHSSGLAWRQKELMCPYLHL